jgi:hypothetical protein
VPAHDGAIMDRAVHYNDIPSSALPEQVPGCDLSPARAEHPVSEQADPSTARRESGKAPFTRTPLRIVGTLAGDSR